MVKHKQTIRRQIADELSVFDHFVKLPLKGLICHVRIYIAAPIVRTKIVKNKLTLMRMIMILVNIKMETLMEKQMTPVIVVKMNSLKIMKLAMISRKLYLQQKLTVQQIMIYFIGLLQSCIRSTGDIV